MIKEIRAALVLFAALTVVTGIVYPLLVTGLAQLVFPWQANGSVIPFGTGTGTGTNAGATDGAGSALVGQPFSDPRYFWSRPSATAPLPYNGAASSGSNQAATNPALRAAVAARVAALRAADPGNAAPVPVDLVTASGSGLDPHVSVAAARYQLARVARARGIGEDRVRELLEASTEDRTLGVLGEPRVNVLRLNRALDAAR